MVDAQPVKLGVVGIGAIGTRYLEWGSQLGAEVAAFDSREGRRAALLDIGGVKVCDELEDLLSWGATHIIVSTPPEYHLKAASPFIIAGLNVLVEKPLAASLEDGKAFEQLVAESSGRTHVVCNMRFHAAVQSIAQNMKAIGRPLYFISRFGHRLSQMRAKGGEFAQTKAAGGGVILDCIHEFDYLSWLLGDVVEVRSQTTSIGLDTVDAEDLAQINVRYANGVSGTFFLDFLRRQKIRGLEVTGEEASLVWLSEGKKPEICTVTLSNQTTSRVLLRDDNLDGEIDYLRMLQSFMGDGSDLQTVTQAAKTLEVALTARN